ncbi:hypothetical protein YC2023_116794 [Brassica napus]
MLLLILEHSKHHISDHDAPHCIEAVSYCSQVKQSVVPSCVQMNLYVVKHIVTQFAPLVSSTLHQESSLQSLDQILTQFVPLNQES